MPSRSRILLLALTTALVGTACTATPAEPPAAFPFALATRECGPADGPAVTMYLASDSSRVLPPGGAYVMIYVWHGLDELEDGPWTVGGASSDGAAIYQDSSEMGIQLQGTVTVTDIEPDSTVEGAVDLRSAGAFAVRGGFRARWIPRQVLCG